MFDSFSLSLSLSICIAVQCLTSLQQCGRSEAVELVSLLGRYEMEGLLYAHDRIAEVSAISSAPLSDANLSGEDTDAMPESAFISSHLAGHSPAHSAGGSSQHHQDRTFKVISLEKSNEPLVSSLFYFNDVSSLSGRLKQKS